MVSFQELSETSSPFNTRLVFRSDCLRSANAWRTEDFPEPLGPTRTVTFRSFSCNSRMPLKFPNSNSSIIQHPTLVMPRWRIMVMGVVTEFECGAATLEPREAIRRSRLWNRSLVNGRESEVVAYSRMISHLHGRHRQREGCRETLGGPNSESGRSLAGNPSTARLGNSVRCNESVWRKRKLGDGDS